MLPKDFAEGKRNFLETSANLLKKDSKNLTTFHQINPQKLTILIHK